MCPCNADIMTAEHLLQHCQLEAGRVARTSTAEGQALWQPGGAEENSRFPEGYMHLRLAYDDEEEPKSTAWVWKTYGSMLPSLKR